jgi:uncharacterized repeat protein (TIGR01451 family)
MILSLAICIVLGLCASATLYVLTGNAAAASGLIRHVATTGDDVGDCQGTALPCRTVQYAVDVASHDDVIKVAAGVYTGVNSYGGLAQVVYLSKTLTLRGGYTTTNWTTADPVANPTTLDAEGQGRVLYITGPITPTIEGLRLTGGDATGRGGGPSSNDAGGGVFVTEAAPTIRNCVFYSNTASTVGWGYGGGLYLNYTDDATLSDNLVEGNIASTAEYGSGGGVYLMWSDATLSGNTILGNVGSTAGTSIGGGLVLRLSAATLTGNMVLSNTASTADQGYGGGVALSVSPATLTGNTVQGNIASSANIGEGGGLQIVGSEATLNDNTIAANVAGTALSTYYHEGGGLIIRQGSVVIMNRNTVEGNFAATVQRGLGGGLLVEDSDITLTGNQLISNTATLSPTATGSGGGLYAGVGTSITLTNNVVAGNQANTQGDGFLFNGSSDAPTSGRLLHTTIADNFGSGLGVSVPNSATLAFTNTIIAGHHGTAIWAGSSSTVTLQATLWYDNGTDTDGPHIDSGTINVYGDPAFLDPSARDYHLTGVSAAIDEGVGAGVPVDIDDEPRPMGRGYDIGADELRIGLAVTKQAAPDPVRAGAQLTYTLHLTNTGVGSLTATITDVLPAHVTPSGLLTWSPVVLGPSEVWEEMVVVTAELGYAGPLTNVLQVSTEEGVTGIYTETSEVQVEPALKLTKWAEPDLVQAGEPLTYTLYVTNTGNVDLHATITDVLPVHVTPSGLLTWTPVILGPDEVWEETVVVTSELGYAGPLTNVLQVSTEEGVTSIYTETSEVQVEPALKLTKWADPNLVQAGKPLTYTLCVTNTGNVDLHATITDVLPVHVTPSGLLTWTPVILGPDEVWEETVVVTSELGYAGPLTNVLQVSTEEGVTGIYTETSLATVGETFPVYLPLVFKNF